jgi:hypothetical protein
MDDRARIAQLENEIAALKCPNPFTTFQEIEITFDDLELAYSSSLFQQIIRVIVGKNNVKPFIKMKKKLCKYQDEWIPMTDNDITYMVKHVEQLFIEMHIKHSKKYSADEFFQKVDVIYGFKINTKKIRAELLNAL